MKFKILTLFFIVLIIALGYFTYPILKSRYFSDIQPGKEKPDSVLQENNSDIYRSHDKLSSPDDGLAIMNNSIENPVNDNGPVLEIQKPKTDGETEHLRITGEYCDGECIFFQNDPTDFKYCQEVCGLNPIQKPTDECRIRKDLEKDYCFKDLAIVEKNSLLCEKINDINIKSTCKNRILQDIIENQ